MEKKNRPKLNHYYKAAYANGTVKLVKLFDKDTCYVISDKLIVKPCTEPWEYGGCQHKELSKKYNCGYFSKGKCLKLYNIGEEVPKLTGLIEIGE